jgi:tRNA modification GTPase
MTTTDTIAAPVTPPGQGGVGIVRVSGPAAATIAAALAPALPAPRRAELGAFVDANGSTIDRGLALWFPGPASYTGEDTVELQGHGGPAVVDAVHARALALGARPARPGEFTERAFLNGRLDLAQAEAVADLIETGDAAGARAAMRSLDGAFSAQVRAQRDELTALRAWIEAALDFPDDDVDHLADSALRERLDGLHDGLATTQANAAEGRRLVEGLNVVIAGAPNAGKSSLLNRLAGTDAAIVTEVAGTTRDVLREPVRIEGVPLTLTDTAGLRATDDPVESAGVRRAETALADADRVLWVVDSTVAAPEPWPDLPAGTAMDVVRSKIDRSGEPSGRQTAADTPVFAVSASEGHGLEALRAHLREVFGMAPEAGAFSARRRHLDALERAQSHVARARDELATTGAGELAAEQLRQAQAALGEITGETTTEDLLGEIFGRFCIGK